MRSKELDVRIHMGPFQAEMFCTSTALIYNLQKVHRHENRLDTGFVWAPACSWQTSSFPKTLAVPKTSQETKSSPPG